MYANSLNETIFSCWITSSTYADDRHHGAVSSAVGNRRITKRRRRKIRKIIF